jgi:hypothetical protein
MQINTTLSNLRLLTFAIMCASFISGCAGHIEIVKSTATIREVQMVDVNGNKSGDKSLYLVYEIETSEPLSKRAGILQFRQKMYISPAEHYLEIATGSSLNKMGKLSSVEFPDYEENSDAPFRYVVFVYRDLKHDHDGDVIFNLLKDDFQKLELTIESTMYSGPVLLRSKQTELSREEFMALYKNFDPSLPTMVVIEY